MQFTWVIKRTLALLARTFPLQFAGNSAGKFNFVGDRSQRSHETWSGRTKSMRDRFAALLAQIESVRESVRDKRICHYDPDWNVIDLFGQLRFDRARLIDIDHDGRRRITLEGSQTNPEHCGSRHQIRTMLF
jgi:hypothetical protein